MVNNLGINEYYNIVQKIIERAHSLKDRNKIVFKIVEC